MTTPHRITSTGFQNGLSVVIETNISDYHSSTFNTYGIRLHIHNAYDYLDDNAEVKSIKYKHEASIIITPERTYSSSNVIKMPISRRMCYTQNERPLKFMRQYSQINCFAECRSEMIYQQCNCVPYFMPNSNVYPVCEMNNLQCVQHNWKLIHMMTVNETCDCLADCNFNLYSADISAAGLDRRFSTSHYELL